MRKGTRVNIIHKGDVIFCNYLETVLSELEKKDRIINEMVKWMAGGNSFMYATKEQIIEKFTNEVEREGK